MRRLLRPTGLTRGITQPQQQQQQRRHVRNRKRLSNYPQGRPIYEGTAPLTKHFPVFELPDVVLDLDAESSPHVRPFDPARDLAVQESKWGYDPVVDEVDREARSMMRTMVKDLGKLQTATQSPFSGARLSDLDIMAVALMPDALVSRPSSSPSDRNSPAPNLDPESRRAFQIQLDLLRNGIPKAIGTDPTKVIPFMLHRRELATASLKDPSLRGPSRGDDETQLNGGIAGCRDLAQLKKVCAHIDSPDSGIEVSTASIDHMHARLLELLRSGEERVPPADILKFVNNLTIKRLSANKELNRSMSLFGLQLASNLGLLPCILQYLQICLSIGVITDRAERVALTRFKVGGAILDALQRGEGTARGTRQQIFTLLIGRGPDGLAPQACLFGLNTKEQERNFGTLKLYITLLGELGALRLLVHHWRQRAISSGATRQVTGNERKQGQDAVEADDVFVKAFLRCAQLLGGVKADGISVDCTAITGDIEKDASLDWRNINAVDAIHAQRDSEIPTASLMRLTKSVSVDDIKDAFNQADMDSSMGRFQGLIRRLQKNFKAYREDAS